MLPGFRFLFAATLLTVSLLVFGLGAAALLRASHERFVSLPKQPMAAPVLTQTADAAPPTLSLLRVEPAVVEARAEPVPTPADTLLPTDRIALLIVAPRTEETPAPTPVVVEPKPELKADITIEPQRIDTMISPKPEPVAEQPVQSAPPNVEASVATPAVAEPPTLAIPVPSPVVETPAAITAEPAPQRVAALPEPDITASTSRPPSVTEMPLLNVAPIRRPPTPRDRPADADVIAALPDPIAAAPVTNTAKPVIRKRKPVVKQVVKLKRRVVSRPAPPRPPAQTSPSPFGT